MEADAIFLHDLGNQLQLLQLLVKKLEKNEVVEKIETIVKNISERCKPEKSPELISINSTVDKVCTIHPDITFQKIFLEELQLNCREADLKDLFINIFKNAKEANGDKIRIELKLDSIFIKDNSSIPCAQDVIDNLNSSVKFTTKGEGRGIGTDSVRQFCNKYKCTVSYYLASNIDSSRRNSVLGIRIKLK